MPSIMPPPCLSIRVPPRSDSTPLPPTSVPSIPPFGIATYSHRTVVRKPVPHPHPAAKVDPRQPPNPDTDSDSDSDVSSTSSIERLKVAHATISTLSLPSIATHKSSLSLPITLIPPTPPVPRSPTGTFISLADTNSSLFRPSSSLSRPSSSLSRSSSTLAQSHAHAHDRNGSQSSFFTFGKPTPTHTTMGLPKLKRLELCPWEAITATSTPYPARPQNNAYDLEKGLPEIKGAKVDWRRLATVAVLATLVLVIVADLVVLNVLYVSRGLGTRD